MKEKKETGFQLSTTRMVKGSRRLVREKVLQILFSLEFAQGTSLTDLYNHIFPRIFRFEDNFKNQGQRLLKKAEIDEMEADIPIDWSDEEKEFGMKLLNDAINLRTECDDLIKMFSENWDFNRIAIIDKLIITIAITEFIKFPEIPVKVSINEAIELSKEYSTDKSSHFINGLLDSVKKYLVENHKIKKEGKGLLE
jgi:N utilization substance protein B